MKSLFDRTRVYAMTDASDANTDGADGIAVTLLDGSTLKLADCGYDDLEALCRAAEAQPQDILLTIPALDGEQMKLLAHCVIRHALWERILFVSTAHRTLDALRAAYPAARISPICDDNMVRPWIYAAYMGAPAYCAENMPAPEMPPMLLFPEMMQKRLI